MCSTNNNKCQQQEKVKQCINNSNSYSFLNILTSPDLVSIIEASQPGYRKRLYTPTETLSMFLAQTLNKDSSCQKAINDYAVNKIVTQSTSISASTGAYCRARKRLPLSMICELSCETGKLIQRQIPGQWQWKGKALYLIDGTTLSMPDTKENQAVYPQPSTQEEGLGFPITRMVCVISLASGAVINMEMAAYRGKETGEQSLLRHLLGTFSSGDVILGDAIYGTYFLLAALLSRGIDAVFEQMGGRKSNFRKGKRLGTMDHLVDLKKPAKKPAWMTPEEYDAAPNTLLIRELRIGKKRLITTFFSERFVSKNDLKYVYKDRWQVELDLRNIKTTMGMDILSCKTPEMIKKEVWVYFLAYNLIRLLMAQSALLEGIHPRKISFKHTVQLWVAWCSQRVSINNESIDLLFSMIAKKRVGNRPGRIEPRAVKRRPKPFIRLNKSREAARKEVIKSGHSKKLS